MLLLLPPPPPPPIPTALAVVQRVFLLIGRVHNLLERFNRHARLFMSLFVAKASGAAMMASELDDQGQLANAQEAYLIAIKYLNMAKMQYANDPSCRELVQT